MGRPKKLSFPCSYCGKDYKRKINLKKHLLSHPNVKSKVKVAKVHHAYRKSFAESEKKDETEQVLKTAPPLLKQEPQDEDQVNNPMETSSNSQPLIINVNIYSVGNQIAQTGMIHNHFQNFYPVCNHQMIYNNFVNQSFNNFSGIANQPNAQNSLNVEHQNQQVEAIPMFDCESELYIKWLKKFITRCKMHKHPLTPVMCQTLNHTQEQITHALENQEGPMGERNKQIYFGNLNSCLTEIMKEQLKYQKS